MVTGGSYETPYKARVGAVCTWSFNGGRYDRIEVVSKAPEAKVITNPYSIAFVYSKAGSYKLSFDSFRFDASLKEIPAAIHITLDIEVVNDPF